MSESILDLTDINLDDYQELTTVKAGEEQKLRITSFIQGTDKRNYEYVMPFFEVEGEPTCKEFGDYMPLPDKANMTEKELNLSKIRLVSFFTAFGIDYSKELNLEDCVGQTGWAILGMGKDQQDEPVNKVNKYIAGK